MECTTISQNEDVPVAESINVTKLYTEAIFLYGKQMQTDVAMEEMGELIQALVKYRRKPCDETLRNVIEEIADVEIMLDQLKFMYDYGHEIPKVQFEKHKRLKARIESEFKKCLME